MYKWYYCYDGDEESGWHGGYDSRAKALAEGLEMAADYCKTITLVEACNAPIRIDDVFDAETVMGDLMDCNDEISDEEGQIGLEDVTAEHAFELELELNATLMAWLIKHGVEFSPYAFGERRNEETIDVPPLVRPQ